MSSSWTLLIRTVGIFEVMAHAQAARVELIVMIAATATLKLFRAHQAEPERLSRLSSNDLHRLAKMFERSLPMDLGKGLINQVVRKNWEELYPERQTLVEPLPKRQKVTAKEEKAVMPQTSLGKVKKQQQENDLEHHPEQPSAEAERTLTRPPVSEAW